jgi:HK97 family phage prohead protease
VREVRTFSDIEIRAEADGTPSVTLQAIKPGVVDDYGSLWRYNTFDESLGTRLPALCWAHDWADPLGPGVSFETTRSGPKIKFNFSNFDAVPQARRAHAQVMDGTIRDCSVGFSNTERRDPTEEERTKFPGVREVITKATLDEVSLVLRGAVPGAKVLAVRSVRVAGGQSVDEQFVLDLARKIASGEITQAEAKAAVELVSVGEPAGVSEESGTVEPDMAALDADIDAALATIE